MTSKTASRRPPLKPLLGMGKKKVLSPTHVLLSEEGARFANFTATFIQQTKGRWARQPLMLEPWQLAVISELLRNTKTKFRAVENEDPYPEIREWLADPLFGRQNSGRRQYREAYIQTPKKQGKSTMSASLALYFLLADGEEGAEVYSIAASSDQAKIVFQQAREMAEASPRIMHHVRVYKDAIWVPSTNSIYRVLGGDADYDEGYNPHAVIVDELHVHKDRKLYDAMTSHLHTGARLDPFVVAITNPGTDPESICHEVYEQAKLVLMDAEDARRDLFAFVPELKENERERPSAWKKVNPASWTQTEDLIEAKKKFPLFVFERRHLNIWTEGEEAWLDHHFWNACDDDDVIIPDQQPIYLGVDLGLKHDTAAVCWSSVIPGDEYGSEQPFTVLRSHVWGLVKDRAKYVPPCHVEVYGERLPLKLVQNFILEELAPYYQIMEIAYDPYRFEQMAQELSDLGFQMVEWPQTDQRMIPATETVWNAIVRDDRLRHNGDTVLRRHMLAAVAEETGRGIRVTKRKATRPVDACIASLMAVARAEENALMGSPSMSVLA